MTELLLGVDRPDRDGCDCPPWVIRCVHREGAEEVLVLADGDTLYGLHPVTWTGDWREGVYRWGVYFISATHNLPCNCGCNTEFAAGINMARSRHHTEADALAAFHAAETKMLGRDDA